MITIERTTARSTGRRARVTLGVLVAVAAIVLVAACGGGSKQAEPPTTEAPAPDGLTATLVSSLSLTPGEAKCVADRADGRLSEATIEELVSSPDAASPDRTTLDEILGACSFEATTGTTLVRQPGEPFTYGDDPNLDRLWDECSTQGQGVCDELFNQAPEGSEYEAFGDTCGGRGPSQVASAPDALGGSSTTGGGGTGTPQDYGDSAELDRLWDACAGGDGQSCGALAFQAPAGSAYATFGQNCGNRSDSTNCPTQQ